MKITIVSFAMAAAFGLIACDNTKHNTLTEQDIMGTSIRWGNLGWLAGL